MMVLSVLMHSNFACVFPVKITHLQTYRCSRVHSGKMREPDPSGGWRATQASHSGLFVCLFLAPCYRLLQPFFYNCLKWKTLGPHGGRGSYTARNLPFPCS